MARFVLGKCMYHEMYCFVYLCHMSYLCLSLSIYSRSNGITWLTSHEFFLSAHFKGRQTSQGVVNKTNTSECSLKLWDCPSTAKFVSISKFASTVRLSLTLFNFEVCFCLQLRPSKNLFSRRRNDGLLPKESFNELNIVDRQSNVSASMLVFGDIWIPEVFWTP